MSIPPIPQSVVWTENPPQENTDGIPWATHSGVLEVFGCSLKCHRLSDGQAIFDAEDMHAMMRLLADPPTTEKP